MTIPILTLTTDFGLRDGYVAAVKGVVLSRVSELQLVDISHEVPPGDVATAAFLLQVAAPNFPSDTVHLAVVDPGVGTERHMLVVDTDLLGDDGDRRHLFVAPDNGILDPFLDHARLIIAVDREDLYRRAPGHTFHGRDQFAPVAAALLRGERPEQLGKPLADPVRAAIKPPRRSDLVLYGTVRHIDHFGNLITDLPAGWLDHTRSETDTSPNHQERTFQAEVAGHMTDLRVDTYHQIPPGRAAILTGSLGTLELSLDGADLADAWGVERGTQVTIRLRPETQRTLAADLTPADGENNDPVGVSHHQYSE